MTRDRFPQRIKELRRQKDISQSELEEIVGLHYTHIGRYERGLFKPSTCTLKRLSEPLGATTDYLIEGETEKWPKQSWRTVSFSITSRKLKSSQLMIKWLKKNSSMPFSQRIKSRLWSLSEIATKKKVQRWEI